MKERKKVNHREDPIVLCVDKIPFTVSFKRSEEKMWLLFAVQVSLIYHFITHKKQKETQCQIYFYLIHILDGNICYSLKSYLSNQLTFVIFISLLDLTFLILLPRINSISRYNMVVVNEYMMFLRSSSLTIIRPPKYLFVTKVSTV